MAICLINRNYQFNIRKMSKEKEINEEMENQSVDNMNENILTNFDNIIDVSKLKKLSKEIINCDCVIKKNKLLDKINSI